VPTEVDSVLVLESVVWRFVILLALKEEGLIMIKKKAMAYWSVVCPGCNMGR